MEDLTGAPRVYQEVHKSFRKSEGRHTIVPATLTYRWCATAQGWAGVAAKDEKMAQWLRDAQQRREHASH